MKTINLSNKELDRINLSRFDDYLVEHYRHPHTNGGYGFYDKSGVEHYSMLAYLSTLVDNEVILDIGTFLGGSALALSYNKTNTVISVDIERQIEVDEVPFNIDFRIGNILSDEGLVKSSASTDITTSGLFNVESLIPKINGPEIIQSSNLILYDTVHDGATEKEFHDYLIKTNWDGVCIWDDILYKHNGSPRQKMQDFWHSIDNPKIDVTKYAHHTGTGLVLYGKASNTKVNLL